jgi:hypothetical protein
MPFMSDFTVMKIVFFDPWFFKILDRFGGVGWVKEDPLRDGTRRWDGII